MPDNIPAMFLGGSADGVFDFMTDSRDMHVIGDLFFLMQ